MNKFFIIFIVMFIIIVGILLLTKDSNFMPRWARKINVSTVKMVGEDSDTNGVSCVYLVKINDVYNTKKCSQGECLSALNQTICQK